MRRHQVQRWPVGLLFTCSGGQRIMLEPFWKGVRVRIKNARLFSIVTSAAYFYAPVNLTYNQRTTNVIDPK